MTQAELIAENEKLKARIAELEQEVVDLSGKLKEALAQLEAQGRASKRQAAPFSRASGHCPQNLGRQSQPGRGADPRHHYLFMADLPATGT